MGRQQVYGLKTLLHVIWVHKEHQHLVGSIRLKKRNGGFFLFEVPGLYYYPYDRDNIGFVSRPSSVPISDMKGGASRDFHPIPKIQRLSSHPKAKKWEVGSSACILV